MAYTLKLEQFEGPLELLLKLIEDEKLDITTISLATVTDQYLAFVNLEGAVPPEEVADFLVVAARLIYIKSKYLLPSLELEEDEEALSLEEQLKIYREYHRASKIIAEKIGKHKFSYMRPFTLKLPKIAKFSPPASLTLEMLNTAYRSVIGRLETIVQLPKIILKTTVSIREKINILKNRIAEGIFHFHTVYDRANKHDVIVSFLALLELVKMREATVAQSELFSEIVIHKHLQNE